MALDSKFVHFGRAKRSLSDSALNSENGDSSRPSSVSAAPSTKKAPSMHKFSQGSLVYVYSIDDGWIEGHIVQSRGDTSVCVQIPKGDGSEEKWVEAPNLLPRGPTEGFAKIQDLNFLTHLNVATVCDCLKLRFASGSYYTWAGSTLIAVNPFKDVPSLYSNAVILRYVANSDQLPPHVYRVAERAYRRMLKVMSVRRNQSIIVSGESGAGKTVSAKHLMQYLTTVSNTSIGALSQGSRVERHILDSNPILEAFGNASTCYNDNSSRFGKYIKLQFHRTGQISGAFIKTYLLEKTRVVHQSAGECNFHIFYQLLNGLENDKRLELFGDQSPNFNYAQAHSSKTETDAAAFRVTVEAMEDVGISSELRHSMFSLLAAILHLGNIQFHSQKNDDEKGLLSANDEETAAALPRVCSMLGLDESDLEKTLTFRQISASHSRRKSVFMKPCTVEQCEARRDCLAKLLFSSLFEWLVSFINSCFDKELGPLFIGLLDIYGFESFGRNSLEQLCINYANECLQQHFVALFLRDLQADYMREGVEWSYTEFTDNQLCIELLSGSQGVFSLLNEECHLSRVAGQYNLKQKILVGLTDSPHLVTSRRTASEASFCVRHYAADVTYALDGIIEKNQDNVPVELVQLLELSRSSFVSCLVKEDPQVSPSAGKKKKTVLSKFKVSLDSLLQVIKDTEPHYIRCLKPNSLAASSQFDRGFVLRQLEACGVVATVRISRDAHALRMPYKDFLTTYGILLRHKDMVASCMGSLGPADDDEEDDDDDKENTRLRESMSLTTHQSVALDGSMDWTGSPEKYCSPARRTQRRKTGVSVDHVRGCCISLAKSVYGSAYRRYWKFGFSKIFGKEQALEMFEDIRKTLLHMAAFTIQCSWRRYKKREARLQRERRERAVRVLQTAAKSWLTRRKVDRVRDKCSRVIQSAVRGWIRRRAEDREAARIASEERVRAVQERQLQEEAELAATRWQAAILENKAASSGSPAKKRGAPPPVPARPNKKRLVTSRTNGSPVGTNGINGTAVCTHCMAARSPGGRTHTVSNTHSDRNMNGLANTGSTLDCTDGKGLCCCHSNCCHGVCCRGIASSESCSRGVQTTCSLERMHESRGAHRTVLEERITPSINSATYRSCTPPSKPSRRPLTVSRYEGGVYLHWYMLYVSKTLMPTLSGLLEAIRNGRWVQSLPNIRYIEVGDGIITRRRLPKLKVRFHTKTSALLSHSHRISYLELQYSLLDCLPARTNAFNSSTYYAPPCSPTQTNHS